MPGKLARWTNPLASRRSTRLAGWCGAWTTRRGRVPTATPESLQAALRDFRATHPHVTVDTFDASGGIDQIMQKLTAGLAGGVPLDVVMGPVTAHMFVETLNILQPLEELARRDRFDLGKYSKEVLDSVGRYNGKVYALPYGYGANLMGVIYDRSLFAAAGAPAPSSDWARPWTWDQFRDALRRRPG
jgi:multiple sugar transport system substrate-binding protein